MSLRPPTLNAKTLHLQAQTRLFDLFFREPDGDPIATLQHLIASGADLNAHDADGMTPLMAAAKRAAAGWIKPLVECGADVDKRSKAPDQRCALEVAVDHGADEVALALVAAGASVDNNAIWVTSDVHVVRAILDAGGDVNRRGTDGATPLHYSWTDQQMMRLLLERGADVEATTDRGARPVDNVIDGASVTTISGGAAAQAFALLIEHDVDLLTPAAHGERPIDRALQVPALEPIARAWLAQHEAHQVLAELSADRGGTPAP